MWTYKYYTTFCAFIALSASRRLGFNQERGEKVAVAEAGVKRAVPAAFDITWFPSELSVFLTLTHILKVYTLFVRIMLPLSEIIPSCSEEMLPNSEEILPNSEEMLPCSEEMLPCSEKMLPCSEKMLPCFEEMPVYHLTCQVNVTAK